LLALPYQGGRDSAQGGEGVKEMVFKERKIPKYNANACFFRSQVTPTTKAKNGNRHATLRLIQRGMTIAIFFGSTNVAGDCHQNGKHWGGHY
jgi:hypothetical protein